LRSGVNKDYAFLRAASENLTPFEQANEVIQEVTRDSPVMVKTLAQTSDQLIFGSRAYSNLLKRQLRDLKYRMEDKDSTEEEVNLAAKEYNTVKETLYINMNYDNPFYGSQEQIDNAVSGDIKTPGMFGGWVNATKRSLINLEGAAATFNEWSGDLVNSDGWQEWGDDWEQEVNRKYQSVNTGVDLFDIRGPGDAFKWVTETSIEFAPQLAAIYAGAKVGSLAGTAVAPGPGTVIGGAVGGIGAGFALAVGNIYNSMPEGEKNPQQAGALALAVGLVDALGIKGGGSLLTKNVLTKEGKQEFIDALTDTGLSEAAANAALKKGVAEVMSDTGAVLQEFALKSMLKRQGMEAFIKEGIKNGGREAVTEGIQEVIAQGGVAALTSEELDWEEFTKDIVRNAAAGGVIGAGFGVVGQSKLSGDSDNPQTLADFNSIRSQYTPMDPGNNKRSIVSKVEQHQREMYGEKMPVEDIARRVNSKAVAANTAGVSVSAPVDSSSVKAGTKAFLKDPASAFRAMANATMKRLITPDGKHNDNMQTYFGLVTRNFIFGGTTLASEIDSRVAKAVKSIGNVRTLMSDLNVKSIKGVNEQISLVLDSNSSLPANSVLADKMTNLNNVVIESLKRANDKGNLTVADVQGDAIWRLAAFDSSKIDDKFVDSLTGKQFGDPRLGIQRFTKVGASEFAHRLKEGQVTIADLNNLMSVQDNSFLDNYMSNNIYGNALQVAERAIKQATMNERYGVDGINLVYLLDRAKDNQEIDEATHRDLLGYTKRLMDVSEGNFQKVENKFVKNINNILIASTTLRLMDMNAFANVGEMFYGTIGLTGKDKVKYLAKATNNFLQGVAADYYSVPTMLGAPYKPVNAGEMNNKDLNRLLTSGHITTGSDVLEVEGVRTSSPALQKSMKIFYMMNLVNSQNNSPRAARMSFAWGAITKQLEKVRVDKENNIISETGSWNRDRLNSYGLDPDKLIETLDRVGDLPEADILSAANLSSADAKFLQEQMRLAEINFTDEFTARPQPGSVPAIFESEVFGPYTQFKRFLAHVTANMIPNMWKNYIKTAPPGTGFDVYSSVVMIVASAYAAQALKDFIAYGGTPEWIEEEDDRFFRSESWRAINYSGFMGTPELLLEELNSVFKAGVMAAQDGDNALAAMALEGLGIAPSMGVIQSDIKAFNEGGERASERLAGMIPFFGSLQVTKQPIVDRLEGSTQGEN
jgi:hypothetical protein